MQTSKPIPALYTVYLLRSTVRPASLYIGSTPNPPRRLRQHNGEAKGGAARTSRLSLRPWAMIVLVSGFPSMVAALKFEWALNNPHRSLHIPNDARISVSVPVRTSKETTRKKKTATTTSRRPPHSLKSVMSNLHLLTGVPSFARWPLRVHFLDREPYLAWEEWIKSTNQPTRPDLEIGVDFDDTGVEAGSGLHAQRGITALPLDYQSMKQYVQKAQQVVSSVQEDSCLHCDLKLDSGQGLYAICPNLECTAIGHLDCWSRYALSGNGDGDVIPNRFHCPSCRGEVRWGDMVKELSLRIRGPKEVEKLLKKGRRAKATE